MGEIYGYLGASTELILMSGLCMVRLFAAMTIFPPTGDGAIQGMLRSSISMMIGLFVAAGISPMSPAEMDGAFLLGVLAKEALIGLVIGFSAATIFWTAESVGALIDTQTGYNNVQMSNPMSGDSSTPVSGLLLQYMIVLFYALGGLTVFFGVIIDSFKVWPIMSFLPSKGELLKIFIINQTDSLMNLVIKFSAPLLLIMVLIDLGLGLISRSAEKLEPTSLGQPVKAGVTILLLALLIGVFLEQVRKFLLPSNLLESLRQSMF